MTRSSFIRFLYASVVATTLTLTLSTPASAGGDWNDSGIAWRSYEDGLAAAKSEGKPVCLVFYTEWCPHCTNYSRVFHDPRIVEKSKSFVMIRLDKDQHGPISARYAPDGEYIPRTYFLAPDGTLKAEITENRPTYKYFYDERDPASLLRAMNVATGTPAAATP
jgi:hypothetical protein